MDRKTNAVPNLASHMAMLHTWFLQESGVVKQNIVRLYAEYKESEAFKALEHAVAAIEASGMEFSGATVRAMHITLCFVTSSGSTLCQVFSSVISRASKHTTSKVPGVGVLLCSVQDNKCHLKSYPVLTAMLRRPVQLGAEGQQATTRGSKDHCTECWQCGHHHLLPGAYSFCSKVCAMQRPWSCANSQANASLQPLVASTTSGLELLPLLKGCCNLCGQQLP